MKIKFYCGMKKNFRRDRPEIFSDHKIRVNIYCQIYRDFRAKAPSYISTLSFLRRFSG